jgi:hypothetical protein
MIGNHARNTPVNISVELLTGMSVPLRLPLSAAASRAKVTPIRHAIYPWMATVIQG